MMSQMEEVRQLILNSLDETELSLGGKQLASLPAEIGQLHSLTKLNLSGNQLASLPAEIGQLHSLTYLNLSLNQLASLPAEIGQLHSLTYLNLSLNQLASLPAEIGQLHSLTYLNLSLNQLASLPAKIGQLHSLTYLDLKYNQLASLPAEIGQLHSLTYLYLEGNQLASLPEKIGQLHSLRELDLGDNQFASLPPEIGQLHSLTYLNLSDDSIQDLSLLANHPNPELRVDCFGVELPRRYWTHLNQWQAEWLLTEPNAEVRRVLIQQIGCDRICQELATQTIDTWREYTLLKIDAYVDVEPIHLLKMTCPSTNHLHVLRVPPTLTSAREAIRWVNWDVDPEAFAVET
ncbi:leucine-rich repeat domain-containing protein [Trichocoleus sp. DQ-A3]|uniref:leucine-rich repeat domain-containing protein n=1 Tax=Cyanophyceae TaxID=3028117 RepID=UPI0016889B07|nr:leucine-rich repeat domain-containing protein [Coleofasciculus sp. FACHB-125]MBD1900535.1 leucine-rich repeat domain-containing protein [Coleofasciculus sp. FACHB-125]